MTALIIVTMQYDFCNGGPLANEKSLQIIPKINRIRDDYDHIIFLKKSHQHNHSSFKLHGGTIQKHCMIDTHGWEIHNDIILKENDIIIEFGTLQKYNSMSGFYDADSINKETKLKNCLKNKNIKKIYWCGTMMETYLYSTIMDALNYRYECYLVCDAYGYIDQKESKNAVQFLENLGVIIV